MSLEQNTRITRSNKKKEIEVVPNSRVTKKADKSQISSYPLKSSKLKGKRLTTFIKKKVIGVPELTRREFLKGLLTLKSNIVTGQCMFADKCADSKSILTGPKRTACKECDLPIHVKCAIANALKLDKKSIAVMIACVMTT